MTKFQLPIEIEAATQLEAIAAQNAIKELVAKLKPAGVVKLLKIYKEDMTVRVAVNLKLGIL